MTRYDSGGLPYAVQLGPSRPPRHDDGTLVITPRLYARLTPVERSVWSGDGLRSYLAVRAYWLTSGELVDGWDADDFASYGLERAIGLDRVSTPAVSRWMREEISRHRTRQAKIRFEPLVTEHGLAVDEPAEQFVSRYLPEHTRAWLDRHLSPKAALAVRVYIENDMTQEQAAETAGVHSRTVARAFETLRGDHEV